MTELEFDRWCLAMGFILGSLFGWILRSLSVFNKREMPDKLSNLPEGDRK